MTEATDAYATISRLSAEIERLREAVAWAESRRQEAIARAGWNDLPLDLLVKPLCEANGYGAVIDSAAWQWAKVDPIGAFYVGGCLGDSTFANALTGDQT